MYQDVWVKGKVVKKGKRECEKRYKKIKEQLNRIKQPFTVLDIGADSGYFSFRIAEDFNAQVTMLTSDKKIDNIMRQNNNKNVKLIREEVNVDNLKVLTEKEDFDVILALSILHHCDEYEELIDMIFDSSRLIFIEASALEEAEGGYKSHNVKGIMENLQQRNPTILGYTRNLRKLGKRPLMKFDQSL
ncbi:class I SAM-dependent methyltransferase [Halobacillus campisalis]|uniref:Methyltransferase n=1 Tax=Halobacillus campisalis TaxID=435909 RepID=A0ABW2K729_9BACI|nr:class I SAM-dependent methyltransferase [Halobacillus campisalis]